MIQCNPDLQLSDTEPSSRQKRYYVIGLLFSALLIGVSAWLTPAKKGYGTHTQLGLPACSFKQLTGVPGPGCGTTTSFAYMSDGQPVEALRANLLGVIFYLLVVLGGLEALINLLFGKISLLSWLVEYVRLRHVYVFFTLWILSWILKLHLINGSP